MTTLRRAAFTTTVILATAVGVAGSITQITTGADVPSLMTGAFFGVAGTVLLVIITLQVGSRRARRKSRRMPDRYEPLARYNTEVSSGMVHTPERQAEMAELQREFYEWAGHR